MGREVVNPLGLALAEPGSPAEMYALAPGVRGYAMLDPVRGVVFVPWLEAVRPGSGDVGRFLDALARAGGYAVPTVINPTLRSMLMRRGWHRVVEPVTEGPLAGELTDVWWPPVAAAGVSRA